MPLEPLKPKQSGLLVEGDLLFRTFHTRDPLRDEPNWWLGDSWRPGHGLKIYHRIDEVQTQHNVWRDVGGWGFLADERVVHVGVYVDQYVVEIAAFGVYYNKVTDAVARPHYDVVIRFPLWVGRRIGDIAMRVAEENTKTRTYPAEEEGMKETWKTKKGALTKRTLVEPDVLQKLKKGEAVPKEVQEHQFLGGFIPPSARALLMQEDKKAKYPNYIGRAIVCSHLVSAILYAAQDFGTVHSAAEEKFDYIFKMTPSHLLHEAYLAATKDEKNLCRGAKAAGMQHLGYMIPSTDFQRLIWDANKFCEALGFEPP